MSDAAILMVHDRGNQVTERLGLSVYGGLLEGGAYAELLTLQGPEDGSARLAAAVRDLAERHDAVDVFLSIHTTVREPGLWAELIPPSARKLRLVYTTACWGEQAELQAWVRVGAQAVVCHVGFNDPLLAMPCVLSRWLAGRPIGEAVAEGYSETNHLHALGLALPGTRPLLEPRPVSDGFGVGEPLSGSRPVVCGDAGLSLDGPGEERFDYSYETGAALGLAVRAAAGRFQVDRADAEKLTEGKEIEEPWGALIEALERLAVVHQYEEGHGAQVEVDLREDEVIAPLSEGLSLALERHVVLRPGRFDPARGELEVFLHGVGVRYGPVRYGLRQVVLEPADEGFQLRVRGTAFGLVPLRLAFPLGGGPLVPLPDAGPLVRGIEGMASTPADE